MSCLITTSQEEVQGSPLAFIDTWKSGPCCCWWRLRVLAPYWVLIDTSLVIISRVLPYCFPSDLHWHQEKISDLITDGQWLCPLVSHTRGWAPVDILSCRTSGDENVPPLLPGGGQKVQVPTQPPLILPGRGIWCCSSMKLEVHSPHSSLLVMGGELAHSFFGGIQELLSKRFCLARLFLSWSFGLSAGFLLGAFFVYTHWPFQITTSQLQVWVQNKENPRNSPLCPSLNPKTSNLAAFLSKLFFILYIVFRGFHHT